MSKNKTISLDDYAKRLWDQNKEQIETVYDGASGFFKEKLKEEVDEGIAERRKKQLVSRKERIEHEISRLEAGFSLETSGMEIDYEETKDHFERGFKAIFEREEHDPRERFEKLIEGRYRLFRKNYRKVPFQKYKDFFLEKAEDSGYDISQIKLEESEE